MSADFTQDGAKAFVGKMFECLVGLPGIPNGTHGRAVAAEKIGDHWDVVIEWDLSSGEGYSRVIQWELQVRIFETRMLPLRYWMTKGDVQRFLQEVQP